MDNFFFIEQDVSHAENKEPVPDGMSGAHHCAGPVWAQRREPRAGVWAVCGDHSPVAQGSEARQRRSRWRYNQRRTRGAETAQAREQGSATGALLSKAAA